MSRALSGRSSRTGLGRSTTVPPFGSGVAGFGVTGSGACRDAGGCGALGSGLRAGASGSLRARSGIWAICDCGGGGTSNNCTATGASEGDAAGRVSAGSEIKRRRPSTRMCARADSNRASRSRELFMNIQETGGLQPQIEELALWCWANAPSLYSFLPMFPRPNTHDSLHRQDKNFPIANASRMGRCHNGANDIVHLLFRSQDFKFGLGQKIHYILCPSIQFCVPFLTSKTFHLCHRQPVYSNSVKALLDFIELERLDDGFNLFHHAPHPPDLTHDHNR